MKGVGGYDGWRWIFIVEGLVTMVFAIVSRFLIVDWPETSKFLSESERSMLIQRLAHDGPDTSMNHFDRHARYRTFTDWKIYVG